jgi:hypothetical protein
VCLPCESPEADSAGPALESQEKVGRAALTKKSQHSGWCFTCQSPYSDIHGHRKRTDHVTTNTAQEQSLGPYVVALDVCDLPID